MKAKLEEAGEKKLLGDFMFGGRVFLVHLALCWRMKFAWTPFYAHLTIYVIGIDFSEFRPAPDLPERNYCLNREGGGCFIDVGQ